MCVMEVRAGQRSSTIAQAMAHNVSTVERDAEMFKAVLEARGESEKLATLSAARSELQSAYEKLLGLFAAEVASDERAMGDEAVGSERTFVKSASDRAMVAEAAAQAAGRFADDDSVADDLAFARFVAAGSAAAHRAQKYESR